MITCIQAIKDEFVDKDHVLTAEQIIEQVQKKYPEKWKTLTIKVHLIGCSVNHKSSKWYPSFPKFLYNVESGKLKLFDPERENEYKFISRGLKIQFASEPLGNEKKALIINRTIQKNLQKYLGEALDQLEPGLRPFDEEALDILITAGKIDLLATDGMGTIVVVKLVEDGAHVNSLDQIIKSIGLIENELGEKNIRGIIIAEKFDNEIILAVEKSPNITLIKYKVRYDFEAVK